MGTNLPGSNNAALIWCEAHMAQWANNFAAIGLTSAQALDFSQRVINTRSTFTSVESIRADAKAKTQEYAVDAKDMRSVASNLVAIIKEFARTSSDPAAVYTIAGLTAADPRSPANPPSQPTALNATLDGTGNVTLGWSGTGPTGTVWIVSRKLSTETSFSQIGQGDVATKSFTDTTVTPGVASVAYVVEGVRGSVSGPVSGALNVYFGSADGAAVITTQAA